MWTKGKMNGFEYEIKHFDEGSEFGINEGRISKLWMRDESGRCVANYDRGWDKRPTQAARKTYEKLLEMYN